MAELDGGEPWRWKAPGLKPPLEPATVPPKGGRVGEKRVTTGSSMKPQFPQSSKLKHHMAFRIISSEEEVDDDKVEVDLDKNMVFPWKTRSVAELDGGEPWRWQAPGLKPPLEPATVPPLSP